MNDNQKQAFQRQISGDATPEKILRRVVDACTDCDTCRFLMEESCLLFPELYRLYDREKENGHPMTREELQQLADLCTLCGLCPCPDIRMDVIQGKTEHVRKNGMPLGVRLLADVQTVCRFSGRMPEIVNTAADLAPVDRFLKKIARIHPHRALPRAAPESFFEWARKNGLHREPEKEPKVAYFAGCTAGYFFPEVARAAVAVLERNGVAVYVPEQQCCGMPTLVEGDAPTTLRRVGKNLAAFLDAARSGCDLVCSCPTCGYFMKVLLKEGAYYSEAYQRSVSAGKDEIKVPDSRAGKTGFVRLRKGMYREILKDDGYFSGFDPLDRIRLADGIQDMGRYLDRCVAEKRLDTRFGAIPGRMVYFAPCHQREQEIGSPYEALLRMIPGLTVERVGGAMDCCGMGGSLGFKESFYERSIRLGSPLMEKINAKTPDAVITDCLSCRLQFCHVLSYPVFHPLEILARAYEAAETSREKKIG